MPLPTITLTGSHVRLEPLALRHAAALAAVSDDEAIWRWMPLPARNLGLMQAFIAEALAAQAAGTALPFATILQATGQAVGSTRFGNIDLKHCRVEIGWTWIAPAWQRTPVNTEAKHLMLRHAFKTLGCIRVELKTDALNTRSRQAILRLGAQEEGTLRRHMVMPDGRIRDTVYFSILDSEWPAVKAGLEAKLARS